MLIDQLPPDSQPAMASQLTLYAFLGAGAWSGAGACSGAGASLAGAGASRAGAGGASGAGGGVASGAGGRSAGAGGASSTGGATAAGTRPATSNGVDGAFGATDSSRRMPSRWTGSAGAKRAPQSAQPCEASDERSSRSSFAGAHAEVSPAIWARCRITAGWILRIAPSRSGTTARASQADRTIAQARAVASSPSAAPAHTRVRGFDFLDLFRAATDRTR